MEKTFRKTHTFNFCLTKLDVTDLYNIIIDDKAEFKITITANSSELSFETNSLDEFLETIGIPEELENITLQAYEFLKDGEIRKSIQLYSTTKLNEVYLNVEGEEQTWVFGKFEVISKTLSLIAQSKLKLVHDKNYINNSTGQFNKLQANNPTDGKLVIETSNMEYYEKGNLKALKLTKDDLIELTDIILKDISSVEEPARLTISTELPGTSIKSSSIQQFLIKNNLPDKLNNITFSVFGKDNFYVFLYLSATFPSLSVRGTNEISVRGKFKQLQDFLNKKKVWYWLIQKFFIILSSVLFTFSLFAIVNFIQEKQIIGIIASIISLIAWFFASIFHFKDRLLPATNIALKANQTPISKENLLLIVAIITFALYLYELFVKSD